MMHPCRAGSPSEPGPHTHPGAVARTGRGRPMDDGATAGGAGERETESLWPLLAPAGLTWRWTVHFLPETETLTPGETLLSAFGQRERERERGTHRTCCPPGASSCLGSLWMAGWLHVRLRPYLETAGARKQDRGTRCMLYMDDTCIGQVTML